MMKSIFIRRAHQLAIRTLWGLRNPAIVLKLMETASYFAKSGDSNSQLNVESLFCSFTAKLRGKRIAGHINKALFDTLLYRGHQQVKITTETDNTGANRQLQSWGFEQKGTFHFYGKEMVTYVLDLTTSPRVSAHNWLAAPPAMDQQ